MTKINKIYTIFPIFFLFLFFSCSTYIEIHKEVKKDYALKENEAPTFCEFNPSNPNFSFPFSFAIEEGSLYNNLIPFFKSFSNKQVRETSLSSIEKAVLITLLHMNTRPDQVSPSSSIQILINNNGEQKFYSFEPENTKRPYPFIHGLNTLLKQYKSKRNLKELASLIDSYYKMPFTVSTSFRQFLISNQGSILADPFLQKHYFHDDEILNKNEVISKLNFKEICSWDNSPKTTQASNSSSTYQENLTLDKVHNYSLEKGHLGPSIFCNDDFELYKNNIFNIAPQKNQGILIAYLDEKNFSYMASISQNLNGIKSLNKTPLFTSQRPNPTPTKAPSACIISFPGSHQINMFISKDRDTGQHMDHFLGKDLHKIKDSSDLDLYNRESRYLFLITPPRLIIESERTSQNQLENIMKLNFPIYHARSIAESLGSIYFKDKRQGLIIDDRTDTKLFCPFSNANSSSVNTIKRKESL